MVVAYIHIHVKQRYIVFDSTVYLFDRGRARLHEQHHHFDIRNVSSWDALPVDKRRRAEILEWDKLRRFFGHMHEFQLWICSNGFLRHTFSP